MGKIHRAFCFQLYDCGRTYCTLLHGYTLSSCEALTNIEQVGITVTLAQVFMI